jgi:hypothetical protein
MSKTSAEFILGRVYPILNKLSQSNVKYLDMLRLQKEKGDEWKEQKKTPEQLQSLIDWKIGETEELLEILQLICDNFGVCQENNVSEEDKKMLEYLHKNDEIKKKLLTKIDGGVK